MTFAAQILFAAAAAEAPENEFIYISHEPPFWQVLLPFVFLGFWLGFCGFAAWFVAGRLIKRRSAGWLTFAASALVPLFLFLMVYVGVSIASGANSVLEIVLGATRFKTEAFIVLASMVWIGCIAATLRIFRHTRSLKKDIRESLDSFE